MTANDDKDKRRAKRSGPFAPFRVWLRTHAAVLLIIAVGCAVYANSLNHSFHFDDLSDIVDNPTITDLSDITAIWRDASGQQAGRRFVGYLSFAVNYHFHKLDVFGYHCVNLLVHITAALLVRWLSLLTLSTSRFRASAIEKEKDLVSLCVALVFLAHPIQTQAVTYIVQRLASMASMFYLLALCLYVKGRLLQVNGARGGLLFAGAALAAVCGMFTKETVFTLPFAVVLYEAFFFFEPGRGRDHPGWRVWGPVLMFALILPAVMSFDVADIFKSQAAIVGQRETITPGIYLLTQLRVIVIYIRLLFFPFGQNFDHDVALSYSYWEPSVVLCSLLLGGIFLLAFRARRRQPLMAFGVLWFFLTLAVESSIIPIRQVIREHRLYLPVFGFALVLCVGLFKLISSKRWYRICLVLIIAGLSVLTVRRNQVWQDEISLWSDVVRKSPFFARGYDNLAGAYIERREYDQARLCLEKALSLEHLNAETYSNLGLLDLYQGHISSAIGLFKQALRVDPQSAFVYNNLGTAFLKQGRLVEAEKNFEQARRMGPRLLEPRLNLAGVCQRTKAYDKALRLYEKIHKDYPHDPRHIYPLTEICFKQGFPARAEKVAQDGLALIQDAAVLVAMGSLAAENKNPKLAFCYFAKALKQDPGKGEVYLEMGKLYGNAGDFQGAIRIWQEGQALFPHMDQFGRLIEQARGLAVPRD